MTEELKNKVVYMGQQRQNEELISLLQDTRVEKICDTIYSILGRAECHTFWNYLLHGFGLNSIFAEKRFEVSVAVLKRLMEIDINIKQTMDITTRLIIELTRFTANQRVDLMELQMQAIRAGHVKCLWWKDLVPPLLEQLNVEVTVTYNDIPSTGYDFCRGQIDELMRLKWAQPIPMAEMFRHITQLTKDDKTKILFKLSEHISKLDVGELPALAFQLFNLCTSAQSLIIPLLAFDKFFRRFEMADSATSFDSIDNYSEKEVHEAEEMVLYHLETISEFVFGEKEIVTALKTLEYTPNILVTPFLCSAMVIVTKLNRQPDSIRMSGSTILTFLRNTIRKIEQERKMCSASAWARANSIPSEMTDLKRVFQVLIDQSKVGMDIVTPGIVALAFYLVTAKKCPSINKLGSFFLHKFLKKRFLFGQGVIRKLADYLIADSESIALEECFTELSLSNTLTVSECVATLENVLENMLFVKGEHAMRMMSFILPIVKISYPIRDSFIKVCRKAMYQKDPSLRQMGVFGFCMLLKQIRNNNSSRGSAGRSNYTQQSISGLSVISQGTFSNRSNPQREFDILTLEIIGMLGKCMSQSVEIKTTMYEGLSKAVQLNSNIVPHVLQFLETQFRNIFVGGDDATTLEIQPTQIVRDQNGGILICENLGQLVQLIGTCLILASRFQIDCDNVFLKDYFESVFDHIDTVKLSDLGVAETLNTKTVVVGGQFIQTLEAFMAYGIYQCSPENNYLDRILTMFKYRNECVEEMKKASKKSTKRKRPANTSQPTATQRPKPVVYQEGNIWNFEVIVKFLKVLNFVDPLSSTLPSTVAPALNLLQKNREFVRFVLRATVEKIENLRSLPDHLHIKYSPLVFQQLIDSAVIIYKNFVKRIGGVAHDDYLTAKLCIEGFKQALLTQDKLFGDKWPVFLRALASEEEMSEQIDKITKFLQETVDTLYTAFDADESDKNQEHILKTMLECLEILYDSYKADEALTLKWYNWVFAFCLKHNIENKSFELVNRMLFNLRIRAHTSTFFPSIANQLAYQYEPIDQTAINEPGSFELGSITDTTKDSCFIMLCTALRQQIDEADFYVMKANSLHNLLKSIPRSDVSSQERQMTHLERTVCSLLQNVCKSLMFLANAAVPLGAFMDNLLRCIIQLFVVLANMTKHFMLKVNLDLETLKKVRYDILLRSTKPLAKRIYHLFEYIEQHISLENDPRSAKQRVLRETRKIPQIVFKIENFSKFVILLGKKFKIVELSQLIHIGTVRDFRIKTSKLTMVTEETDDAGDSPNEMDDEEEQEETEDDDPSQLIESEDYTDDQVLRNIKQINKQTKKARIGN